MRTIRPYDNGAPWSLLRALQAFSAQWSLLGTADTPSTRSCSPHSSQLANALTTELGSPLSR